MAKPQVTLTFAGDESRLTQSFDRVGASARTMSGEVGSASSAVGASSSGFDTAGAAADNTYSKFDALESLGRGTTDTMSGLGEIMKGNVLQGATDLAGGVAALADGVSGFLIPAIKAASAGMLANTVQTAKATAASVGHRAATIAQTAATTTATVAQKALNAVLRANPIGLVITILAALAAAVYVAYQRSATFRAIVQGAFTVVAAAARFVGSAVQTGMSVIGNALGWAAGRVSAGVGAIRSFFGSIPGFVSGALSSAASWVSTKIGQIVGFFTGLPGRVRGAMGALGSAISAPFRSALDGIKWLWNNTVGRVSFSIPSWVPGVGGKGWSFPKMHTGGIVPGAPGTEQLTLLQAGERVTPAGRSLPTSPSMPDEFTVVGTIDLGEGITQVVRMKLRAHDRAIKRAVGMGSMRAATA